MPLSPDENARLQRRVTDHWVDAQAIIYAYDRAYKRNRKRSEFLKWGTIISAIATAGSAVIQPQLLSTVSGVLTAGLAASDQAFSPNRNVNELWDSQSKLEAIKRELVDLIDSLDTLSS